MFITIEGIDGSGKSTQAGHIARWLEEYTHARTIRTFEPGDWDGSFRELILSRGYAPLSELLLFLADRSEHVHRVILPALREGHNVVCERYNDSTLAYQSGGHALNLSQVQALIDACDFPPPDVTLLFTIDPELAFSRITKRETSDKFESEGLSLMRRVSEAYEQIARSDPERFIVTPCDGLTESEVLRSVITSLKAKLEAKT